MCPQLGLELSDCELVGFTKDPLLMVLGDFFPLRIQVPMVPHAITLLFLLFRPIYGGDRHTSVNFLF